MKKLGKQDNTPEVKITSLKSVLEWLKPALKAIDNPNDLQGLEIIINEIGKCPTCLGSGEVLYEHAPDTNYKVKFYPRGQKRFAVKCGACKGEGKILEIQCVSCGVKADRQPAQRHLTYCNECEAKLTLSGILK